MIIERAIAPYVVHAEEPVLRALEKITANKARIVFCVSEHGHLVGSLTDGDVRRWIAAREEVDLTRHCAEAELALASLRRVDAEHFEIVALDRASVIGRRHVGKAALDRLEAAGRGRVDTLQQGSVEEQVAEMRGEARHAFSNLARLM